MKQQCRTRVSTAIGRDVSESEAAFIEGRISKAATALAREDIAAWRAMTPQQQTLAATERAAGEIEAAARAVVGNIPTLTQIEDARRKAKQLRVTSARADLTPEQRAEYAAAAEKYEAVARGESAFDQVADTAKKADITFPSSGMGRGAPSMIRLYQARDESSFIHEGAHYFLEMMRTLAAEDGAAAGIKQLSADADAWLDATWNAYSPGRQEAELRQWGDKRVWGHEMFARTFEVYAQRGIAPSSRLRTVFAHFRRWLRDIVNYMKRSLDTNLSPEAIAVFDRMLATDQEIAAATEEMGLRIPSQQALKLNDEQYAALKASWEDAKTQAEDALRARVEADFMRQKQADWQRQRQRYRRTATLEVNGAIEYRAAEWLGRGRWLDGASRGAIAAAGDLSAEEAAARAAEAMRMVGSSARDRYRLHSEVPKAARDADWHILDDELAAAAWAEVEAESQAKGAGKARAGYAHLPAVLDALRLGDGGIVDVDELRRREQMARAPLTGDPARDALTRSGGFDFARGGLSGPVQGGNVRPLTDTMEQRGPSPVADQLRERGLTNKDLVLEYNDARARGARAPMVEVAVELDLPSDIALANYLNSVRSEARRRPDAAAWLGVSRDELQAFLAGAAVGRWARRAEPRLTDTFEQFAGQGSETADMSTLSIAYQMLEEGADPDEVREEWGWFKGQDGHWRYEIDDSKAGIDRDLHAKGSIHAKSLPDGQVTRFPKLASLVQHPELFAAYPFLRNISVIISKRMDAFNAVTDLADLSITISPHETPSQALELLLHEVQHVIQIHEGFAMGGNEPLAQVFFAELSPSDQEALLKDMGLSMADWKANPDLIAHDLYQRIAGEVEAYDTQDRARMTAQQRTDTTPAMMTVKALPSPAWTPDVQKWMAQRIVDLGIKLNGSLGLRGQARDPFYSALTRTVAESKTAKAPAAQWKATLAKTPGLKREEIDWTGVNEWLDAQEGEAVAGQVVAYRGEGDRSLWEEADRTPEWGAFYATTPEVANTRALQFGKVKSEPNGGRVYRDTFDTTNFETWDLKGSAPSGSEIRQMTDDARARGVPGLILENVRDTATPVKGRPRNTTDRQYLVIDRSIINKPVSRKPAVITREELLSFVQANGVRVEETVLGGDNPAHTEIQRELLPLIERRDQLMNQYGDLQRGVPKGPDGRRVFSVDQQAAIIANQEEMRALEPRILDLQSRLGRAANGTKWSSYTLPGGTDYRELLLRLPVNRTPEEIAGAERILELDAEIAKLDFGTQRDEFERVHNERAELVQARQAKAREQYRSGHWDEPNVLAHIRFKERTDSEGRRILAIEEVQSDWHQAGREKGYSDPRRLAQIEEEAKALAVGAGNQASPETIARWNELQAEADRLSRLNGAVPDAPFKDNKWAALSLKRMIRWASENGFDAIAWIPGDVAVERFGLEKVIDSVELWRDPSTGVETLYTFKNDRVLQTIKLSEAQTLESVIGKDLAEKLRNSKRDKKAEKASGGEYRVLSGIELKTGGEGMRAFYDKILPNIANDIGKKYGARVGDAKISIGDFSQFDLVDGGFGNWRIIRKSDGSLVAGGFGSGAQAEKWLMGRGMGDKTLHTLPLTEALRDQALQGQTFFQRTPDPAIEPKPDDLLPMKLSPEGVADYVDAFGPDVVQRLAPYIERGDKRDIDAIVAELNEAKRAKPSGKRLWVWVRDKGGINDGDIASQVERKRHPGLIRQGGRGIDELARAAVEEGMVELSKDEDGYVEGMDIDVFRERLLADTSGDPQYPAHSSGENEAYQAGQRALAQWESMGVNTNLSGKDLRESVRAVIAEQAARAVHPEDAAAALGFQSGSELIQTLLNLPPRAETIERETDKAMARDGNLDPFADGTFEREAKRLSHNEARARVMEIELDAIERASGGRKRAVAGAAKEVAERQAQQLTIRQIANPDQFIAIERRFGLAAQRALEKGDYVEASRAKHRQLVAFYLYRAASRANEVVEKTTEKWKRLANNPNTRKAIASAHLDQIDALFEDLKIMPRSGVQRESLEDWAATMEAMGLPDLVAFNPGTISERAKSSVPNMTFEDFDGLREAVANIEFIGRNVTKLAKMKSAQDFASLKSDLLGRLLEQWPEKLEKNVSRVAPRPIDKLKVHWKEFGASRVKIDYLARLLDGLQDNGPWAKALSIPAQAAQDDLTNREIAAMTQFRDILKKHKVDTATLKRWLTVRHKIEEIGDERTMHQIISYAFNVGNAYNREALMNGEGWSAEQLQAVLSRLGEREWNLVRDVALYVGQWKEESFALDERTRGVRPQSVEPEPFFTPYGQMPGWYWPVAMDPDLSDRAAQREAKAIAEGEMGAAYRRPATHRGRLKSRQGTGGQALSSDWFAVLDEHVRNTLVDITHREMVIDLARLKGDSELRAGISAVAGKDALKALDAWITRLSRKTERRQFGEAALMKYLNRTYTVSAMAFKFSVSFLNILGALQAIPRNGVLPQLKQTGITLARDFPQMLLAEAGRMLGSPMETAARVRLVREKSAMMSNRMATFDRDMQDENTVGEVKRGIDQPMLSGAMRAGRYMTGLVDTVVSVPTWIAAYEGAIAGKVSGIEAMDEDAAVAHADNVVRNTQGAGSRKDLAAILATTNEYQRALTLFMSWASGFDNQIFMEQIPGLRSGKITPLQFAVNSLWIWIVPAIITTAFFGKLAQGDDEDDDEYARRLAATLVAYPGQSIPFVRDAVSLAAEGRQPLNPYTALGKRAYDLRRAIENENEEQIFKQSYLIGGSVVGAPVQFYVTGDYLYEAAQGEEDMNDLVDPETAPDAWREMLVNDQR